MNAHAFRSDDLATACRTTVEQEEECRRRAAARDARRAKWTDRERRFTWWWQNEYGTAFSVKIVLSIAVFVYCCVLFVICMEQRDDVHRAMDKLACYRACVMHKPIVAASRVATSYVCLCYRADGTPAMLVPEAQFEELRKP